MLPWYPVAPGVPARQSSHDWSCGMGQQTSVRACHAVDSGPICTTVWPSPPVSLCGLRQESKLTWAAAQHGRQAACKLAPVLTLWNNAILASSDKVQSSQQLPGVHLAAGKPSLRKPTLPLPPPRSPLSNTATAPGWIFPIAKYPYEDVAALAGTGRQSRLHLGGCMPP